MEQVSYLKFVGLLFCIGKLLLKKSYLDSKFPHIKFEYSNKPEDYFYLFYDKGIKPGRSG